MAPAPAAQAAFDPEPTFAAEPLAAPVTDSAPEVPARLDAEAPRRPLKPVLLGGAAVVIAGLIGAIAWIGSTAGQQAKKAEPALTAPEGMSAKALPPPDFSHPPAPEHVPSAIPLPPHADGGTPEAPAVAPEAAAAQGATMPPAALAGAAALATGAAVVAAQPDQTPAALRSVAPAAEAPVRAMPVVRDEVRVARRAKAAAAKTATAKAAAVKRAAKAAAAKKTARTAVPAKRKAATAKTARKAVPVRCTARNKAAAACRAK